MTKSPPANNNLILTFSHVVHQRLRFPMIEEYQNLSSKTSAMAWKEPYPRRLPHPEEYIENKRRIKELDAKIEKLRNELQVLETERNARLSFITPFHRLPQELLAEIALRCVRIGESPQMLNQICLNFREAVNNLSILWNKIYLHASGKTYDDPYRVRPQSVLYG